MMSGDRKTVRAFNAMECLFGPWQSSVCFLLAHARRLAQSKGWSQIASVGWNQNLIATSTPVQRAEYKSIEPRINSATH